MPNNNNRNQQAKQEFALAQARAAFARAVSAGQTGVIDRFGAVLATGDSLVFIAPPSGYIWQVKAVGPNLDPNVQPGAMKITLVSEVTLSLPAGRPVETMMRIIRAGGEVAEVVGGDPAELPPPVDPPAVDEIDVQTENPNDADA